MYNKKYSSVVKVNHEMQQHEFRVSSVFALTSNSTLLLFKEMWSVHLHTPLIINKIDKIGIVPSYRKLYNLGFNLRIYFYRILSSNTASIRIMFFFNGFKLLLRPIYGYIIFWNL